MIYHLCIVIVSAMHRVGSVGNTNNSTRPRKEKRLTYVLNDSDDKRVRSLFVYSIFFFRKMDEFYVCFFVTCIFIHTDCFCHLPISLSIVWVDSVILKVNKAVPILFSIFEHQMFKIYPLFYLVINESLIYHQ